MPSCHGVYDYPAENKPISEQIKNLEDSLQMEIRKNSILTDRIKELEKENKTLKDAIQIIKDKT